LKQETHTLTQESHNGVGGNWNAAKLSYLQSQSLPQLHSFLSFIGQFLPVFLQLCFSAAKEVVQIMAARIDIRIVVEVFITTILATISGQCN